MPVGSAPGAHRAPAAGFTLIETLVATLTAALLLPGLYALFAAGFSIVQTSREDLRATQVILQQMEAIRLSSYKALQDSTQYPTSFTGYYSDSGRTNGCGGVTYSVSYTPAPGATNLSLPLAYGSNMLVVTVSASWKSGNVQRNRSMKTYVSRYGIQRYVAGS